MIQGLSDVYNPNFKPKRGNAHEQQLFKETKMMFMLYWYLPQLYAWNHPEEMDGYHESLEKAQ